MLFLLCLVLGVVMGQAAAQSPADPVQDALDDLVIQTVARTLDLQAEEITELGPILEAVKEQEEAHKKALDELHEQGKDYLDAVFAAWVRGRSPDAQTMRIAEQVVQRFYELNREHEGFITRQARAALELLPAARSGRVQQPPDESDNGGGTLAGAAEYIADQLLILRFSMPRDYAMLRVPMAFRLASGLADPETQEFADYVNTLLMIQDAVRRMTDAQFAENRARLPFVVAQQLELPPPITDDGSAVSYADFRFFITSPRTPAALRAFKPAVEEVAP